MMFLSFKENFKNKIGVALSTLFCFETLLSCHCVVELSCSVTD